MKNNARVAILAVICLVLPALLAACQPAGASPQPPVTQPPTETSAAPAPLATPPATPPASRPALPTAPPPSPTLDQAEIRQAIVAALLALNTRPNRMEVTTALADGQVRTNVIEFVPPDRKRIVSPDENVEYIVAEGKVYLLSSGQWQETALPASTLLSDATATAETIAATISQEQFVRQDQWDGAAVLVYSYSSTTTAGEVELHSQTELWVGADDGLPHQMIVDGEILSASTDPATGASKMLPVQALTTTRIAFDPGLQITPPAP